ncbi:hypothetical protein KHA96_11685 [Bacillus sp. FJAT-49711]|uniref:hypothetical protein n=1 Tax=Bacillus sp. FJAT-49711 TaxID=2833585 RepID=UPI001BC9D2E8|nr:hypothetical protein [Bacillus sp. FJAT-49711]MBS4218977.1 hypothetical protein [Bacillus sp. FJAT-49711]
MNLVLVSSNGEKTDTLKTKPVKITNNKGKSDTIAVGDLVKGDVVKVYNASSKGKFLASTTSKGKSATLTVKQLGLKSGKIYISIKRANQLESARFAVFYTV